MATKLHELIAAARVLDLSHPLTPEFPLFPVYNPVEVAERFSVAEDGFFVRAWSFDEHCGTHVDAPAHFGEGAATVDQILSSLELAPGVDDPNPSERRVPTVTDVVHSVAERFRPFADLKGIHVQVDVQELDERLRDFDHLDEALGILMDNAMHYVQPGGQVVIGVRWMEHKNKPLLLFFVMDNGPMVPEHLRAPIFEPDFVWNPQSTERTGRSLFKAREFAVAHSGSVWVESKTGKACTFFLRVRPDGVA